MKRTLRQVFEHMMEDCRDIADAVARVESVEGMESDRLIRKSIVFSLLNLGEMAKVLERFTDLSDSGVNWKGLKGMREVAAHRYKSMNSEIIWRVATDEIPVIAAYLAHKYANLPDEKAV